MNSDGSSTWSRPRASDVGARRLVDECRRAARLGPSTLETPTCVPASGRHRIRLVARPPPSPTTLGPSTPPVAPTGPADPHPGRSPVSHDRCRPNGSPTPSPTGATTGPSDGPDSPLTTARSASAGAVPPSLSRRTPPTVRPAGTTTAGVATAATHPVSGPRRRTGPVGGRSRSTAVRQASPPQVAAAGVATPCGTGRDSTPVVGPYAVEATAARAPKGPAAVATARADRWDLSRCTGRRSSGRANATVTAGLRACVPDAR